MAINFQDKCRELGISPSITRKKIYEFLDECKTHPTADEIYRKLVVSLPTLSKTTVYNVLSLFLEKGLVEIINTEATEKRYEISNHPHSHFHCKECHQLFDVPKISIMYNKDKMPGFQVSKEEIYLIGICPSCSKKI